MKSAKQPSGLPINSQSSMYFFDMRVLLATILSTTKGHVFHAGMANIVDNPSEYWHSRSWGSSIRTCSQDYVVYPDMRPVIPSGFVDHLCNTVDCATKITPISDKLFFSVEIGDQTLFQKMMYFWKSIR